MTRLAVSQPIAEGKTAHHSYALVSVPGFGKTLFLDGDLQSTEADQAAYHAELLAPARQIGLTARRVLIAGIGPGGSLAEVLRIAPSARVTAVDIDEDLARSLWPHTAEWHAGAVDDPRVELVFDDVARVIARAGVATFDLVVLDLTDFVDVSARVLGEASFWRGVARSLAPGGLVLAQAGDPMGNTPGCIAAAASTAFEVEIRYRPIPSFQSTWAFLSARPKERS